MPAILSHRDVVLDLLDEKWQIGMFETDSRCRDSIVFDIRRNMFVVRVSGGQLGNVGMFKRIVPGDFLSTAIDFVTVVTCLDNGVPARVWLHNSRPTG